MVQFLQTMGKKKIEKQILRSTWCESCLSKNIFFSINMFGRALFFSVNVFASRLKSFLTCRSVRSEFFCWSGWEHFFNRFGANEIQTKCLVGLWVKYCTPTDAFPQYCDTINGSGETTGNTSIEYQSNKKWTYTNKQSLIMWQTQLKIRICIVGRKHRASRTVIYIQYAEVPIRLRVKCDW